LTNKRAEKACTVYLLQIHKTALLTITPTYIQEPAYVLSAIRDERCSKRQTEMDRNGARLDLP